MMRMMTFVGAIALVLSAGCEKKEPSPAPSPAPAKSTTDSAERRPLRLVPLRLIVDQASVTALREASVSLSTRQLPESQVRQLRCRIGLDVRIEVGDRARPFGSCLCARQVALAAGRHEVL